jgi:hypothetical protein
MKDKMNQTELFELFSSLYDNLENPEFCNLRIEECISGDSKDIDEMVHIMYSLRTIKDKLPLWESFIQYCRKTFEELGEDAENLICE